MSRIPSSHTDTSSISGPISLSSWVPFSACNGVIRFVLMFNWLMDCLFVNEIIGISQREMRGYGGVQDRRSSPYFYIAMLIVLNPYRGRGIGKWWHCFILHFFLQENLDFFKWPVRCYIAICSFIWTHIGLVWLWIVCTSISLGVTCNWSYWCKI